MTRFRAGAVFSVALGTLLGPWLAVSAAAIAAGDAAPPFTLPDTQGKTYRFDKSSAQTHLLVFVKPNDHYATDTLAALNGILKDPEILPKGGVRRVIVLSRYKTPAQAAPLAPIAGPQWRILLDRDDEVYRLYKIVATPTVVLAPPGKPVALVNPGYDSAMATRVREGLIGLLGAARPRATPPAPPYMPLQMGRHLAAKKLWDNALVYYRQAEREGRLPPEGRLEMAEVYLEIGEPDKAVEMLGAPQIPESLAARKNALLKRAHTAQQQIRARNAHRP